jgi:hypothetical protein
MERAYEKETFSLALIRWFPAIAGCHGMPFSHGMKESTPSLPRPFFFAFEQK